MWGEHKNVWRVFTQGSKENLILFYMFEIWFLSVASASLELTVENRLGLELPAPPASASLILWLKACATMPNF